MAKNELAAYLVSSADLSSINKIGFPCLTSGEYKVSITCFALSEEVPITTLSGFIKSSTATPSLKNSGLETTSKSTFAFAATLSLTFSAVPTGTVLLSIITVYFSNSGPKSSATFKTYLRSADPSSPGGVGNAKNITSASLTPSANDVVNSNLPCLIFLSNRTSRPGS